MVMFHSFLYVYQRVSGEFRGANHSHLRCFSGCHIQHWFSPTPWSPCPAKAQHALAIQPAGGTANQPLRLQAQLPLHLGNPGAAPHTLDGKRSHFKKGPGFSGNSHISSHIIPYIYIYMCVCVCV